MNIKQKLALLLTPLFLLACNDDSDDYTDDDGVSEVVETASVRIVHASPDAPTVNVTANGELLGFLTGVDYQQASESLSIDTGASYDIAVEANTPAGPVEVLSLDLSPDADVLYNAIAVGSVVDETLELLTLAQPSETLTEGNVRATVVHAAENAPAVDVYITAFNDDLDSAQANATLDYKANSGSIDVPGGEYQIRITAAGTKTVVFDSGAIELPANNELLVLATSNVAPGNSPVALTISNGASSSVVLDTNTPAALRAVHGVADAPAVDIIANNTIELFDSAIYTDVTDYLNVEAGDYNIDVAVASDNSTVAIDDANVSLEAGVYYTAIANNELATIDLDLITENTRRVATAAQVRIFHAASLTSDIDIYLTTDGEIADVAPAFTDIPYLDGDLADTGYAQISAGDYVVTVTPSGSKTEVIETGVLSLQANKLYTAFAVNGPNAGDAPVLLLADDFVE
ncbi:DUF4397 domain-containing protein [Alteromonas hispanica]|uniref:DUF4397 domain-containing protein n=1 Tax=Alteromonas hispanica TaxID=315421 RepID=UPI0019459E25